jgi:hypothetical protein
MKTVTINLYSFDELSNKAKQIAIEEHNDFLRSEGEIRTREEVEESILINEYFFYSNGQLAPTVKYTGKHEKAGETYFLFQDEQIKI